MRAWQALAFQTRQPKRVVAVDNHAKVQSSKLLRFVPWEDDDDNHDRPFPPYAFCLEDDVHADGPADAVRTPQPFYISSTTTSTAHTAIKSPGRVAASLEFSFTSVQWKELERQATIYKFIKASVPVPPDLLIPINGSPSVTVASQRSALGVVAPNQTFSSSRGDLEPGRCRRTDGKKWRCSRDVALGQKYCERHMHRGRPRSRKPVELPKRKTCHTHTQALPSSSSTILTKNTSTSQFSRTLAQPSQQNQTNRFPDKLSEKTATFWPVNSVSSCKEPKNLDWILNEELVPLASSDQRWYHLMQIGSSTTYSSFSNAGNSFVLNQNYREELLTLNSDANLNAAEDQQRSSCFLSLNSEIVSLEKCPDGTARGIIDEWSTGAETSVYSNGKLSLSSLSPSMGIDNIRDDEMGRIQIGLGVTESDQNHEHASTSHVSSWSAPASWAASTPGGPLAEVLRPGKITTAATTAATKGSFNVSPLVTGNADSCSPLVTAVSSPSGVLQRTLVSLSDSSCSSSPKLGSSGPNWRSV